MLYGMAHIEPRDLIQVDEEKLSPKKTLKLVFDSKPTKIHEFNAEKNSYKYASEWKNVEAYPLTKAKEITPQVMKEVVKEAITQANDAVNHEYHHSLQRIEVDGSLVYDAAKESEKKIAIDTELRKTGQGEQVKEISLTRGDGEEIFHRTYDGVSTTLADDKKEIEKILNHAETIVGFDMSSDLKAMQRGGIDLPKENKYIDTFKLSEQFAKDEIKAGHSKRDSLFNYVVEMGVLDLPIDKSSYRSWYVMRTFDCAKDDRGDFTKVPQLSEKFDKKPLKSVMRDIREKPRKKGLRRKTSSKSKGMEM